MVEDGGDDDVFVYTGGDQVVPRNVRRVKIDICICKFIPSRAFYGRGYLIYVEFHDGVRRIEEFAFPGCTSLRSVKSLGVKIIEGGAFNSCENLEDVEFNSLETIGNYAFMNCTSLRSITMPSLKIIVVSVFDRCEQLIDLDLPEGLETIQQRAFQSCERLRRIAMPMKDDMIANNVFLNCPRLSTVDLVGGIHRTVSSLHLEGWRNEMKDEIYRINQVLPDTEEKTAALQEWMSSVISQLDHYKAEHKALLKEATTLLELALWKANLDDNDGGVIEQEGVRTTRGQRKRARKEICVTSGASIVIKNVLPFLSLLE